MGACVENDCSVIARGRNSVCRIIKETWAQQSGTLLHAGAGRSKEGGGGLVKGRPRDTVRCIRSLTHASCEGYLYDTRSRGASVHAWSDMEGRAVACFLCDLSSSSTGLGSAGGTHVLARRYRWMYRLCIERAQTLVFFRYAGWVCWLPRRIV